MNNIYLSSWDENLEITRILERLYLSDDRVAYSKHTLDKHKITHVLNATTDVPNKFVDTQSSLKYLRLLIFDVDTQNIAQYFDKSYEFIENALGENESNRVLVHSNAGKSRSTSFVIAYLLQKSIFESYEEAYNYVKKRRPLVKPNAGFERQLIELEKRLQAKKQQTWRCVII